MPADRPACTPRILSSKTRHSLGVIGSKSFDLRSSLTTLSAVKYISGAGFPRPLGILGSSPRTILSPKCEKMWPK